MRKLILFLGIIWYSIGSYSQCYINAKASVGGGPQLDTVEICLGEAVNLSSSGACSFLMNNNFNNGQLGVGWSSTAANPVFNNPCQCNPAVVSCTSQNNGCPGAPGPNGAFAWVGTTSSQTRTLETVVYDVSAGGCKINFWMMYGVCHDNDACEDPDATNEGVHLQYSLNGGGTWTDFPGPDMKPIGNTSFTGPFTTLIPGSGGYWTPESSNSTQLNTTTYFWNKYVIDIPPIASTVNTKFRWAQLATSSTGYDAWGIDEVEILCPSLQNVIWSHGPTTFNPAPVYPITTGWYTVSIYDSIQTPPLYAKDSVYVIVHPIPVADISLVSPICGNKETTIQTVTPQVPGYTYTWDFGPGVISANGTGAGPYQVLYNPLQPSNMLKRPVSLKVTSDFGCVSTIVVDTVELIENPTVSFMPNPLPAHGCAPITISFLDETSPTSIANIWYFGDGSSTTNNTNPSHTYSQSGSYTIKLIATGPGGCIDSTEQNVVDVWPNPDADFSVNFTPQPLAGNNFILTDLSTVAGGGTISNYFWDFGDGSNSTISPPIPVLHTYDSDGPYTIKLVVVTNSGCMDSITKNVRVVEDSLIFPNVITPNGDGINDYFYVENLENYISNVFSVYNRWGKKVYEKENYIPQNDRFDGRDLPDGTYFIVLKYRGYLKEGEYSGSLTILRGK